MSGAEVPEEVPEAAARLLRFWREAGPERWFRKDDEFDRAFADGFAGEHRDAAARRLDGWMARPDSALALLILLDQYPRNAFRGTAHMFATDPLALSLAHRALRAGLDAAMPAELRAFCYMPLMHAEDPAEQERCVALCEALEGDYGHHARVHRDVVARFGRFPHRNPLLGRDTTDAERAFLDGGGFGG